MRPAILNPLFASAASLPGIGAKLDTQAFYEDVATREADDVDSMRTPGIEAEGAGAVPDTGPLTVPVNTSLLALGSSERFRRKWNIPDRSK